MTTEASRPQDRDEHADSHYRAIVDSAIDFAIIATDTAGVVSHWSRGATEIFGWRADEVVGRPLTCIFTDHDLASQRPALDRQRAAQTGRSVGERWYVRRDLPRFWGQSETTPLKGQGGDCVGFVKIIRDNTAKQVAAAQLREARGLSELILGSSRDCIVVLDLEGHTLELSAGGVESMEVTDVQAILGLSWLRVWKGADHAAACAAVASARAGGVGRFRGYCPTHSGKPRWWDVVISPLPDADGKPERLVSVGRDITESMLAQVQFRTIAEAMPNHVWTSPPNGQLDWFNEQVYRYSGAAAGELDGEGWTRLVHADDLAQAAQRWAEALGSGQPYETEFRLRRTDGAYRWHLCRAVPVRADDGTVLRWVGTNTDIEEQRAAREGLAALNATLEEQVETRTRERDRAWQASQDLQAILDGTGVFLSVNRRWTEVLGWQADEIIGRSFLDFVHEDDHAASHLALAGAAESKTLQQENRYRHKREGHRWISWRATHDGDSMFASGRHVSAEKLAAEELQAAQDQLRQAQKMEAVGQLTGGIAHDFNNILQIISGNLQLLTRLAAGHDKLAQRVESSQAAVKRGAKLASQLLAFSRQQPLNPRPVHAGRLLSGMEDMLRRALGETIDLEFVSAGGLWNTFADPSQIENAVLNLCINARDAMSGNGKLTIEVGNVYLDERYAQQQTELSAGPYVMIAVSDTGTGMPPEVAQRAFEPFFTTKPAGSGSGLGLAMVYGFVKQSGGHVKAYSEPGQGTTMKLYLPRSLQDEEPAPAWSTGLVPGGSETVLVAEDDDAVRATSVDLLRELGYHVLQARDAESALVVLQSGAAVDLLFTDVVMPGRMKSTELVRLATQQLPRLAVLFTSGYTQNAIVHGGRLDAGVELLVKPFSRDDLARKVRQLLDRRPGAEAINAIDVGGV